MLWGSAYPAIKHGYALLHIGRNDLAAQLLFAGYMVFPEPLLRRTATPPVERQR